MVEERTALFFEASFLSRFLNLATPTPLVEGALRFAVKVVSSRPFPKCAVLVAENALYDVMT